MTTLQTFESGPAAMFAASLIELQKSYDTRISRLEEELEDMRDAMALRAAVAAKPDMLPQDIVERLVIVRENPVRVFREFRGLSQVALSRKSGVRQTMLSEIEAGKKKGSVTTLKALADALDVDLDDLV